MRRTRAQGRGGEAQKIPQESSTQCRKRGDWGRNRGQHSQESVGSVAADPDNPENSKEAGREPQGTRVLSRNCRNRERVSPQSRLMRDFVMRIIDPPSRGPMRVAYNGKVDRGPDCAVMCNLINTHTNFVASDQSFS